MHESSHLMAEAARDRLLPKGMAALVGSESWGARFSLAPDAITTAGAGSDSYRWFSGGA